MTNAPDPADEHHPPPPAQWTPPPTAPWPDTGPLARPRTIKIASILWICLGVILILGMLAQLGQPYSVTLNPLVPPILIGVGIAFIVLATRMRAGSTGARTALTVLGAILLLGLWTALLIIPAMALQARPSSRAWFHAVNQHRQTYRP
ncbi:hypothetical protein [Actinomadura meridiana]